MSKSEQHSGNERENGTRVAWMNAAREQDEREREREPNYVCQTIYAYGYKLWQHRSVPIRIHFPKTRQTKHLTCASKRFPFPFNEKFVDNRLTHTAQTISHYSSATRRAIQIPRLSPIDTPATDKYVRCKPNG